MFIRDRYSLRDSFLGNGPILNNSLYLHEVPSDICVGWGDMNDFSNCSTILEQYK